MDLYKKIDKSIFRYGTTIPKEYHNDFIQGQSLNPGESRDIELH